MARKTKKVDIDDRGTTKKFLITELSAVRAEKFAIKFFFAAANAGVHIPDEVSQQGVMGILQLGLEGIKGIPYEKVEPLLDELMSCVQIYPDPVERPDYARDLLPEEDIDDFKTLLRLKKEVFTLHVGF